MYSKLVCPKRIFYKLKNKRWRYLTRAFSSFPSEERIIKSPAPRAELPKGNFVKTVFRNIDEHWMKTALECAKTDRKFTYAELVEQTSRWSEFLRQRGVGKGDMVSMISPNCLQFPPLLLGTASIGASFSPINSTFTPDEIRRFLNINKAKIFIFSNELETKVAKALGDDVKDYQLFSIGKSQELNAQNVDDIIYGEQKAPPFQPEEIDGNEILFIPFSSGTTGLPKAVTMSHNALAANIMMYTNPYHDVLWEPTGTTQKVQFALLPFFQIYGFVIVLSTGIYSGARTVIESKFTPQSFIDSVIKYKVNYLHTVPSLLNVLNSSPICTPETIGNLNSVFCVAAPVLKSSIEFLRKKLRKDEIVISEGYGMTELGTVLVSPKRFQYSVGCGHLLSNAEGKVISTETGASLGPNETGEICIKTPTMMQGYLDNPTATSDFIRNGWGHTGDIGYYDNDEFFYVVDRTKDLIKVHGVQVSPTEIEEELQKHSSVADCSVIGIPDDRSGEVPFAFVVLKKETSKNELQSFLMDRLAKHKQLRGGIKFVDKLPKSDTGKTLKKQLRMMV